MRTVESLTRMPTWLVLPQYAGFPTLDSRARDGELVRAFPHRREVARLSIGSSIANTREIPLGATLSRQAVSPAPVLYPNRAVVCEAEPKQRDQRSLVWGGSPVGE